jgi:hypothetical protein
MSLKSSGPGDCTMCIAGAQVPYVRAIVANDSSFKAASPMHQATRKGRTPSQPQPSSHYLLVSSGD